MATKTAKAPSMFMLLEQPQELYRPGGCCVCGARSFPMLDLLAEIGREELHLYVCKTHAREIAKGFGYVKGQRSEELDNAAQRIGEIEYERDNAKDAAHKMAEEVTRLQARIGVVEEERDALRDRYAAVQFGVQKVVTEANLILVAANGEG